MAKASMIAKDKRKNSLIEKNRSKRKILSDGLKKGEIRNIEKLTNSRFVSITRRKNRCNISGRPRGYVGFFKLSRTLLREIASAGLLPGVKKN